MVLIYGLLVSGVRAQNFAANATILPEARPAVSGGIELRWPLRTDISSYRVIRRTPQGVESPVTVAGNGTGWLDAAAEAGLAYEYRIRATRVAGNAPPFAYGNVLAAADLPLVEDKGQAILLVEDRLVSSLNAELVRWEQDVAASGYGVDRLVVSAANNPTEVRNLLKGLVSSWPSGTPGTLFIVGRVPQAYSGNIYPDGHTEHRGAWPTDGYYADLDGTWTDDLINNISAARPENRNVIGDGKFDQSSLPSDAELMVGRVDLSRLPAFAQGEIELLRRYFNKDHAFRTGALSVARRAVVDDNFAYAISEAPSGSARTGCSIAVGSAGIVETDFVGGSQTQSALMGVGFGFGEYSNITDACSTVQCVNTPPRVMFTLGFGSYFGDYDNSDAVLRAILASDSCALASCWCGRPQWQLHPLGLGRSLGYVARLSQNAASLNPYNTGYFARSVHVNLLGDPTLELFPAAPVLSATVDGNELHWTAGPDADRLGFAIYRRHDPTERWQRQNATLVTSAAWTDPAPTGFDTYLVKSVRRETTASGTYFSASQGVLAMPGFPTVELAAVQDTAQEYPAKPAMVRVSRDCLGPALPVAFNQPTGTATEGADYVGESQIVTIPEGRFYVDIPYPVIADGLPEGTETIGVSLAPSPDYAEATAAVVLQVQDHPYEAWCRAHFGTVASAGQTGPNDDPDHDGISNLLEFGLGSDPMGGSANGLQPTMDADGCHLHYLRRTKLAGLKWTCETTCDLITWQSNPTDVTETVTATDGGMESVDLRFPVSSPRCFLRVRVEAAADFFPQP